APGELLPPIRTLAGELSVSAGTVAAAYRLLAQRGLVVSDGRRGTRLRSMRRDAAPVRRSQTVAARDGAIDLSSGAPDPELLPDLTERLPHLRYEPATYGSPPILPQLAERARSRFAVDGVPATHLTCSFGALDGIMRVLSSSLRPGDRVALEDPGWPSLLDAVQLAGLLPIPLALDPSGPLPDSLWDALAAGARAVVVTSRAQNPTGACLDRARATELSSVIKRYPAALLIEDDHGGQVAGARLCSMGDGSLPRWVVVRSLAKSYGPDLRLALLAGDPTTIARVDEGLASGAGWVSHLIQALAVSLWSDPAIDRLLDRAASTYGARREALVSALGENGIGVTAETGLNVWVPVADEAGCVAAMSTEGYLVTPGTRFRIASPPAVRLTAGLLAVEAAPRVAASLVRAMQASPHTRV
ncbi:MAG: aminotransferase class I/II-fold pyridoxal phosphate-dependent enzyme, partial [Acidimicrobiales bacterium]